MPAGGSTSRTSWWCAPAASSFAQALDWTGEVYLAAGRLMAEAGKLKGVADEGGYWPEFATNEEALEMLVRAIERAGLVPGDQVAIALDVAASELGRGGRYRLGLEGRELDSEGHDRACCSAGSSAIRSSRSRIRWPRTTSTASPRSPAPRATGSRWWRTTYRDRCGPGARGGAAQGAANTLLVKPNQRGTLTETRAAFEAAQRGRLARPSSRRARARPRT